MIQQKIKALFQFIEFLHSNIENFNKYNSLINQLEILNKERQKLNPENNYKDKLQYNKVQTELESKFKTLQDNTSNLIKAKARELNVCNFDNEPNYSFNGVEAEIRQLKDNFSNEDLPEIFKHKSKYLEYRTNTHSTFLSLQFFFDELDEITKSLFDYFKDTERNEFEEFETKTVQVSSIVEAVEQLQNGKSVTILENPFNTPYNGMFATSQTKTRFKLNNGSIQHRNTTNNTYDLRDTNLYNNETGELIEIDTQSSYNTSFLLKLGKMYLPNVKPYLTHQLKGSLKPVELIDYVKYCALNSEIIKSNGMKQAISDWLIEQEKETPQQQIIKGQNDTKKVITELFEIMDNKGFEYAFKSEQDYNVFTDVLTKHFEYKDYSLPENTIQLKRSCKTKLAATLGKIHSELSNVDKFSSDTEYFEIVKCLSHYTDLSNDELYKSLTRNRKDY